MFSGRPISSYQRFLLNQKTEKNFNKSSRFFLQLCFLFVEFITIFINYYFLSITFFHFIILETFKCLFAVFLSSDIGLEVTMLLTQREIFH